MTGHLVVQGEGKPGNHEQKTKCMYLFGSSQLGGVSYWAVHVIIIGALAVFHKLRAAAVLVGWTYM